MKSLFAAIFAALVMPFAAFASDLPTDAYNRPVGIAAAPTMNWTGFYAGVNAGYAFGDNKVKGYTDAPALFGFDFATLGRSSNEGSFTGGAQLGYNYQMGRFVAGAEADYNYLNLNDHYAAVASTRWGDETISTGHKVQSFGTLRGRLGFLATDRLMVYGTAGLAAGSVKSHSSYSGLGPSDYYLAGAKSDTRWGWTIGAGAEYALTNSITAKLEYLYTDLGSKHYAVQSTDVANVGYTVKDETNFHIIRAGLNYRFGTW